MRGLLVLLLLAPAVQALAAEAEPPIEPVVPGGEALDLLLRFTVPCDEWFAAVGPTGLPAIALTSDAPPPGIHLQVPASIEVPRGDCTTPAMGTTQAEAMVQVRAAETAVASYREPLGFLARLGETDTRVETTIAVEYIAMLRAEAPITSKMAGPQKEIRYLVELENLGNGLTKVEFRLAEPPKVGQVVLPSPVILGPAGDERSRLAVEVVYATPFENGQNDAKAHFALQALPSFALDPEKEGTSVEVEFNAATKGMYVPGLGALWTPLVLLALAVARARRPA